MLTWYFAAKHTKLDSLEKRNEKGFLITIGDEPGLTHLPATAIKEIFGTAQGDSYNDTELLNMVSEKYEVFHIHINHGGVRKSAENYWKKLLGQKCVIIDSHEKVPQTISDIIINNMNKNTNVDKPFIDKPNVDDTTENSDEIIL